MDYTVHAILQARILEWLAFPFSRDIPNPGILNAHDDVNRKKIQKKRGVYVKKKLLNILLGRWASKISYLIREIWKFS